MTTKNEVSLERCPVCFHLPTAKIVDHGNTFTVELSCEEHGHEAHGDTLESANRNWNLYITLSAKMVA